jgi:uncharacterized CHY-type Zn-finger protein
LGVDGKLNFLIHNAGSSFQIKACGNCYPKLIQEEYKMLKKACKYPDKKIEPLPKNNNDKMIG